jgi:hypothetical protein
MWEAGQPVTGSRVVASIPVSRYLTFECRLMSDPAAIHSVPDDWSKSLTFS